jgi:hypothetical protein
MQSVAKKAYATLEERMTKEEGLNPYYVSLTLNAIKGHFYSPFVIAKDLKQWIGSSNPADSNDYHWYELCTQLR